jgi:hypothetical protein
VSHIVRLIHDVLGKVTTNLKFEKEQAVARGISKRGKFVFEFNYSCVRGQKLTILFRYISVFFCCRFSCFTRSYSFMNCVLYYYNTLVIHLNCKVFQD